MADFDRLVGAARDARRHAVAPYSGFLVGAALLSTDGRVTTGCNIENASYGLTVCAERVALWKAVSEGIRGFSAMAIVSDREAPATPCGACRQLLWEFGGDMTVVIANLSVVTATYAMRDLLPMPFDDRALGR